MRAPAPLSVDWSDEATRQLICSQEVVTHLGRVQSHGAVAGIDPTTGRILFHSENIAAVLHLDPTQPLPTGHLRDLVPPMTAAHATGQADRGPLDGLPGQLSAAGTLFDVSSSAAAEGGPVIVEFEAASSTRQVDTRSLLASVQRALSRLSEATTLHQLQQVAAAEISRLTGFDRVMVYAFHPDNHGEVVAEECPAEMEPYLGLHYPASDIPAQARALYVRKSCRHTADAASPAARFVSTDNGSRPPVVDLSWSDLRAVSEHHLQFMANMGTLATLSLSIVDEGVLVGMISCNHRTPRHVDRALRQACEILAAHVSSRWQAIVTTATLSRRLGAQRTRKDLIEGVAGSGDDIAGSLTDSGAAVSMTDLIPADAVAVRLHGATAATADGAFTGDTTALDTLVAGLQPGEVWCTESLARSHAGLAAALPGVAGLIVARIDAHPTGHLAWFRQPVLQTAHWLGDQRPGNRPDTLSPRNSFTRWQETVTDQCLPWGEGAAEEAAALAADVAAVVHRRAQAQLAHLSWHDELTGLPNRRLLLHRLAAALGDPERRAVSLLYVDLDHFKNVNDTHGHAAGDLLLTEVSERLLGATRSNDTVARIGGDEFLILCPGADDVGVALLADRVIDALQAPVQTGQAGSGDSVFITASIGAATARTGQTPNDLIRAADSAMYRAKQGGRNQLAH